MAHQKRKSVECWLKEVANGQRSIMRRLDKVLKRLDERKETAEYLRGHAADLGGIGAEVDTHADGASRPFGEATPS